MKILFVYICAFLTSCCLFLLEPESLSKAGEVIAGEVQELLYKKELRFAGLEVLEEGPLRDLLPNDKSVVWWLFNKTNVAGKLEENPVIENVQVMPCSYMLLPAWGCFQFKIKERTPAYIAHIAERQWLLDAGGKFILPLPASGIANERFKNSRWGHLKLPTIRGLMFEDISPQLVRTRLDSALKGVRLVQSESGLQAEDINITKNGELIVKFRDLSLQATFDYPELETDRLKEEALRLKRLINELGAEAARIATVDLAFNNVAVVSLIE